MKCCKRCKGTGRVYEGKSGDDYRITFLKVPLSSGKNSVDGKPCPRCGGRGEV